MKFIVFAILLFCSTTFAQTYDLKDYPAGTQTIEGLKAQYSAAQIKNMLEGAELCRNKDRVNVLGMRLQDPISLENIMISDTDSTLMLFEYLKKLKMEIANLKQRLQTAGIP